MDYSILEFCYDPSTINKALEIAKHKACLYPESYYCGEDFEPHIWAVAAVCAGLTDGDPE